MPRRRDFSATRNAADPRQVRRAAQLDEDREARTIDALYAVLSTMHGRLVMWDLIARAGVYRSIWDPSAKIHYNAGRQDFGHELLALCLQTDERLYLLMETEARERNRADAAALAASTKPREREQQAEGATDGSE